MLHVRKQVHSLGIKWGFDLEPNLYHKVNMIKRCDLQSKVVTYVLDYTHVVGTKSIIIFLHQSHLQVCLKNINYKLSTVENHFNFD